MNEAITKQEELMALVSLLAGGLTGKSWMWLVPLVPSAGAFLILLFFRTEGCRAQAVIPSCSRGSVTLLQWEDVTPWNFQFQDVNRENI
jgi:hypothetical protein